MPPEKVVGTQRRRERPVVTVFPGCYKRDMETKNLTEEDLKRLVEKKLDEMNKASFPASDSPAYGAIKAIEHEILEKARDQENRREK
jgi:hypothetical protein